MIIGIDLGTTNSAVGIWRDGRAELIPNSLGSVLTPSAVSLTEQGELLVGSCRARAPGDASAPAPPRRSSATWARSARPRSASSDLLPEELSALVLRSLKADAERFLGETVTDAVITVPAYFNDKQRQATRRAGQLAGLKVERLLNEPTAAALAYGIHQKGADTRFLVFDLGGGTFDVSILEIFDGVIEVRASTGDNHLGGEDFNELLIDKFFAAHRRALAALEQATTTTSSTRRCATRPSAAGASCLREPVATMSCRLGRRSVRARRQRRGVRGDGAPLIERLRDAGAARAARQRASR